MSVIGNFKSYHLEKVKSFLYENYNLIATSLDLYNEAMDNTVLDIDHEFIFKIYENKTQEHIEKAILNVELCPTFYGPKVIKNNSCEHISLINGQSSILYKKIMGTPPGNPEEIITWLANFHQACGVQKKPFPLSECYQKMKDQIKFYLNDYVCSQLKQKDRWKIYEPILEQWDHITPPANEVFFNYGLQHGDASPKNILQTDGGLQFIDFDSLQEDFQMFDLIDFFLKCSSDPLDNENDLLKMYCQSSNLSWDKDILYFFNFLCCAQGITMALSTEYYLFQVKKFSEDTMNRYFLNHTLSMLQNIQKRLEFLLCTR